MRAAHRRSAARATLPALARRLRGVRHAVPSTPAAPPRAIALLEAASEGYAMLQRIADSLTTRRCRQRRSGAERRAQHRRSDRAARGEFEDVTVSMSTRELEQHPLALDAAGPEPCRDGGALPLGALALGRSRRHTDEVRDLAEQLAGALELARASSRMAADQLQAPPAAPPTAIATFRS